MNKSLQTNLASVAKVVKYLASHPRVMGSIPNTLQQEKESLLYNGEKAIRCTVVHIMYCISKTVENTENPYSDSSLWYK